MKNIYYIITTMIVLSGCSQTLLITQGEQGYAGELDNKYEISELNKVTSEAVSVFGLGRGEHREDGLITNLVAQDLNYTQSNLIRLASFITYSSIIPITFGANASTGAITIPLGILFGGILNNVTWARTSSNEAITNANMKLIKENPDIDLFIYPKYNIQSKNSLLSNRAKVSIFSKGARLKTK
ncbi:MAG: hypothetical protein CMD08_01185 [Flavobacteriales bacterium]|nr:hypothetical protein [Flavobacteriales bacterium]